MKKPFYFILFLLLFTNLIFAQTIVNNGIYKASFSNTLHEPRWVSYILYHGGKRGGEGCDRSNFHFKNDQPALECATDGDYSGRGFDKGHLANAEDFSFDCEKDELTFRYYNCLPQTPNLNRGVWKSVETKIRKWSQDEKLYIVCGGYFGSTKMGNAVVPACCWKVVQSVATKKVLFCGWFTNSSNAQLEEISPSELDSRLQSHVILLE